MMEKWTDQQVKAFSSFGHNIIVSAGAGSGKTSVLSQRVYHHVGKRKIDVDKLLVLTFTNKAADEMKDRIRKKIILDEEKLFGSDEERNRQVNKIDSSYIMTFDAYALSLIKKYHYLFNIDRNIKVIDANVLNSKVKQFIDEIFLEEYHKKNKTFIELIDKYCVRDDSNIKDAVYDINQKLEMIYERNKYLEEYENSFYSDEAINSYIEEYTEVLKNTINEIRALEIEFSYEVENTDEYFGDLSNIYSSKTYEQIKDSVDNYEIVSKRLKSGSSEKASTLKKAINDKLSDLKLKVEDKNTIKESVLGIREYSLYILKMCEELNKRLDEYKKSNNLYSFIDIFKMAIELVDRNEDVRNEIRDSFVEILIDEYQDTNDLQDEFIKRISNDNVYMVGDIKQSIYRFRNANPELFKEKYETYSLSDKDELIELPHNFRSRSEVLEDINVVFDRVMDSRIGGADFLKAHHMLTGREDGVIENQNNHLEILSYEYDSKEEPFDILDRKEYEAFVLAKDILDRVGKYKVNDNGTVRSAQFSDFCILVDRTTNFDMYKQILTYHHIPCVIETDEKMSDSPLITVVRDIFKILTCIDNDDYTYEFEYAYVSLARSFLFEMSDSEIYEIMKNKLFEDTRIMKLIRSIYDSIESKTISDILDEIIDVFDVYEKILKIKDVKENQIKIDYLYQLSHGLNEMAYDYKDFDEYLKSVFESGDDNSDIRYSIDKGGSNAVKIINIHKAKGLQYKICYYVALDVQFNKSDLKDKITFSKDLGVIIPEYIDNRGLKDTIVKQIFKYRYDVEDTSERIRLFYVALTRCEEKMIMICPLKDKHDSNRMVSDYIRIKYSNFNDLLSSIYGDLSPFIKEIDYHDYLLTNKYRNTKKIETDTKQTDRTINIRKHWDIPAELVKSERYSKDSGLIDLKTIENMELGTRLHYYLETLDFNNPDYTVIEKEYVDKIKAFMNSGLMDNVKDGKAYKEYEFVYEEENVLKHGFIDLLMEYDDHFDIIDYKFMNIDDSHYDEQLNGYRKYINSISDKRVYCYLYSIMQEKYREVKERED